MCKRIKVSSSKDKLNDRNISYISYIPFIKNADEMYTIIYNLLYISNLHVKTSQQAANKAIEHFKRMYLECAND